MTRYELLDRIGVGGMAEIFRGKAVAAGGFEKPVAIKRILPHLSQDKRFVELLIAEAKVLSLLKHRNIVQIYDVGLGDDGQYFLVMEYVDGKDLGAVQRGLEARRRRIPFDLALHVGAEICEALEHAHSARAPDGKPMSLVHRDVSPSNVLLSRAGEVKLTDFGIAKRAEQESTGHGAVRGKFAYISPEQARNEHIEPRSDVFSVGILLWELVTSRRLFSGLSDMEALRAVREAQVPRPREFDAKLSPDIDALIMAALSPEPRVRPTAGQLGARLRSLRYALDVTVGDPATELARTIDTAEEVERQNSQRLPVARAEFEASEATVIRIHTADAFSMRDRDGDDVARAREVIDRFEEEETRQSRLSRDQMAFLRAHAQRDSDELAQTVEPPLPGMAPRRRGDDRGVHAPISTEDVPTLYPGVGADLGSGLGPAVTLGEDSGSGLDDRGEDHFDGEEATRLLPPAALRTPVPERPVRASTQPPGTVHERSGRGAPPPGAVYERSSREPPSASAMQATPVVMQPPMLQSPPPMPQPMPPVPLPPAPLPPSALPSAPAGPMAKPPGFMPPGAMPPGPMSPTLPPGSMPPGSMSPAMSPAVMATAPMLPPPPVPYGGWAGPPQMPIAPPSAPGLPYRPSAASPQQRFARSRRSQVQPWMLIIGALVVALLAFAVTRACIHSATRSGPVSR
ncbi:MAG TPA: serine/threonine-protein kinase [Kofleriaceae bacterium]|nr:serine/threonine-protein kinase [Kofleriaceae bacterium]